MIATAYTKPDKYIACPNCGKGDHLIDGVNKKGFRSAWYCHECGVRFSIEWSAPDQFILGVMPGERVVKTLVTIESSGPVRLVVEGIHLVNDAKPKSEEEQTGHDEYHYNDGTCPTNYLGNVRTVIDPESGDDDPHGIFVYVKTEPWKERE